MTLWRVIGAVFWLSLIVAVVASLVGSWTGAALALTVSAGAALLAARFGPRVTFEEVLEEGRPPGG